MPSVTILTEDRIGLVNGQQIDTAYDVEYGAALDRAAGFRFYMSAQDIRVGQIETINSQVRIYEDDDWVYLGIVEGKRLTIGAGGEAAWEITGRSKLVELAEAPAGEQTFNGTTDISGVFPDGWSFDPINGYTTTGTAILGRLVDESSLLGLVRLAETIGEHFIYRPDLSDGYSSTILGAATSIQVQVTDPAPFLVGMSVEYDITAGGAERNVITNIVGDLLDLRDNTGNVIDTSSTLRSVGDRMIIWLRDDQAASGLIAEQSVTAAGQANADAFVYGDLEVVYDGAEIVNKLTVFGAGNADARLSIASTSYSDGAVGNSTLDVSGQTLTYSGAGYDKLPRWKRLQFPTITPLTNASADIEAAADMLVEAGVVWLDRFAPEHEFYRLRAARVPPLLRPGQTVRVLYEDDLRTIDKELLVLELSHSIDERGIKASTPLVSTVDRYPTSESSDLQAEIEQGKLFQAHPQRSLNTDTQNFREIMDSDNAAELAFELGPEVSRVIQAVLRFRIDALRSPVKAVAGSVAGSSASSESGGTHSHKVHVVDDSVPGTARLVYIDVTTTPNSLISDVSAVGQPTTLDVDTTTSEGGHVHDVPFELDLSAAISTTYGVYDEDADNGGANTLAEGDLVYKVAANAGAYGSDLGGAVGGPTYEWYELDLTGQVADADGIPIGQAFQVQISTASSGKYATITGRLVLRTVIQNTIV